MRVRLRGIAPERMEQGEWGGLVEGELTGVVGGETGL